VYGLPLSLALGPPHEMTLILLLRLCFEPSLGLSAQGQITAAVCDKQCLL
jgi:hypothetical protein